MPQPIRVLHIGDVHLGIELYGRPDPEKGYGTRTSDFLAALDRALALAPESDIVLFPGDIYKNCDPPPTVQREFARRVRATARTTPVVIIPGNHDQPAATGRASSVDIFAVLEVDGVHVLRSPEVRLVETARGPVLIAGAPFLPRSRVLTLEETRGKSLLECVRIMGDRVQGQIDRLAEDVQEARSRCGEDVPAILMTHYTVQGAVFGGYGRGGLLSPEVEIPLGTVKNPVFDYVALAHIHQYQTVPKHDHTGQPPVVYPGSIERVDFGEEAEEKVVVQAEVRRGQATLRPVSVHARRFLTLRLTASEEDPLGSLLAAMEQRKAQIDGAVVRVIYTLPAGAAQPSDRELRRGLESAYVIAGIRREGNEADSRARHRGMTTTITPLQALEEFIRTDPKLVPMHDDLIGRATRLVEDLAASTAEQ